MNDWKLLIKDGEDWSEYADSDKFESVTIDKNGIEAIRKLKFNAGGQKVGFVVKDGGTE